MTSPIDTGPGASSPNAASTSTPSTTSSGASPSPAVAAQPFPGVTPPRRGMRVGTVVWGLVLAAIGAGVLAWAIGVSFDVELAFIVLVAAAGVLLLGGSVATTLRRRR